VRIFVNSFFFYFAGVSHEVLPGRGWPIGPEDPGGGSPPVSSGTHIFYFLLWSEKLKGSLKREKAVSRVFLPGQFYLS
jgi:hypothetical protein